MEKKININGKEALKKGGKLLDEFKAFVLRGNIVDMAIGVFIGGAFSDLVTAFTDDFIKPLINSIGGAEFGGKLHLFWTAEGNAGQYLLWGNFLTSIINFLIMAFVLFIILKIVNKLVELGKSKEEEKPAEAPKKSDETLLLEEIRDLLKKKK